MRVAVQISIQCSQGYFAGFMGGSADLAPSNMTLMKAFGDFQKDTPSERNFRFGVREHGMGAIANGMFHHKSGIIPYCATFFIFTGHLPNGSTFFQMSHLTAIAAEHPCINISGYISLLRLAQWRCFLHPHFQIKA